MRMSYPVPLNERERLAALDRYKVLDTPPEAALDRITRLVAGTLGVPVALISLVDRDRQWFKSKHGLAIDETPRDVAFCAHAICGDDVLVVPDASKDARFADNPLVTNAPEIRFYAGAPLRSHDGHNLGTLCAIDHKPHVLNPEQTQLLTDLAGLVVDEFEYRRAGRHALREMSAQSARERELYRLAMTDPLTGAFNRRALSDIAEREWARAIRHGHPLSLLTIDIDHFKRINDRFGHAVGDDVLKALVQSLQGTIRTEDCLGRVGGEEFVILFPDTNATGARAMAERLKGQLAELCPQTGGMDIPFTVSIGATECHPARETLADALKRADGALYRAKEAGRNRVVYQEAA